MLIDTFNRTISYLRVSVTDRCNFRCTYCMAEDMTFLPKSDILSLEELYTTLSSFVQLGINKMRITGGEPLVRRDLIGLIERLSKLEKLQQLAMTTNGTLLGKYADDLYRSGVTKLNISIDSLKPDVFKQMTRIGKLDEVVAGIDAAVASGIPVIRLNAVVLKGINDDEIIDLVAFARDRAIDIAFIEEMPLGDIGPRDRNDSYCSSTTIIETIGSVYPLEPIAFRSAGPARYFSMADSSSRVGVISPHSNNFCGDCNRIRLTVEGRLLLCLGNEHSVDLRTILRSDNYCKERLEQTIVQSMAIKPQRHEFDLKEKPQILRFMNTTGG